MRKILFRFIAVLFILTGAHEFNTFYDTSTLETKAKAQAHELAIRISKEFAEVEKASANAAQEMYVANWSAKGYVELQKLLAKPGNLAPATRATLVFNAEGKQAATSYPELMPTLDVSDRPYYVSYRQGQTSFWYGPYTGRNTNRSAYAHIQALPKASKPGFILHVVSLEYLNEVCAQQFTSPKFMYALITSEDRTIAGCGVSSELLKSGEATFSEIFAQKSGEILLLRETSPVRVGKNIYAIEKVLGKAELYVAVAVPANHDQPLYVFNFILGVLFVAAGIITLLVPTSYGAKLFKR